MSSPEFATHAESAVSITPRGSLPTAIGSPTTSAVEGSIRVTVSSPLLATHTKRRPTKIPDGLEPTPIGLPTDRRRRAVDAVDRVVVDVGHPHELLAEADRLRPVADGDLRGRDDLARGLEAPHGVRARARRATRRPCRPRRRRGGCRPSIGSPITSLASGSMTRQRPVLLVGDEHVAAGDRDAVGALADLDRRDGLRLAGRRGDRRLRRAASSRARGRARSPRRRDASRAGVVVASRRSRRVAARPGRGQPGDEDRGQRDARSRPSSRRDDLLRCAAARRRLCARGATPRLLSSAPARATRPRAPPGAASPSSPADW